MSVPIERSAYCHQQAGQCLRLAEGATSPEARTAFLELALRWLQEAAIDARQGAR
jgi:hypothetical protein